MSTSLALKAQVTTSTSPTSQDVPINLTKITDRARNSVNKQESVAEFEFQRP